MADSGIKITMTPSHPGDFIRTEIVEDILVKSEPDCDANRAN